MKDLLFHGASEVVTCERLDDRCVRTGSSVLVRAGRILEVGDSGDLARRHPEAERVDCAGAVLTPGFVDSHTHAVFGRWRADEYALRCQGVPYMEIARRGGGIKASVRDLRARTEAELVALARPRLAELAWHGTTTVEVKSGYGLSVEDELKTLRAIRTLAAEGPLDIVPTFMGAHEFPEEFQEDRDGYVDLIVSDMIPAVAAEGLAVFCDVFMEPGVFTAGQTRRILEAGLEHGLIPKLHADELEWSGGAELAAELRAASADHLGRIGPEGIRALASATTVATLLPATLFFLGRKEYSPARALLEAGATIALATDFNPGSAPSPRMALALTIACSQMGLSPLESLVAATAGGARALCLDDGRGTLGAGAPADIILWDAADHREIPYRFGSDLIRGVWKAGARIR
jgi:imidazolonepropionase